jgi:hypothetical protein
MRGKLEDSRTSSFRAVFKASAVMGRLENVLLIAGASRKKKCAQNSWCYFLSGPPQKQFFAGPGKVEDWF